MAGVQVQGHGAEPPYIYLTQLDLPTRCRPDPPLCVFIFYDLPNRDCNAKVRIHTPCMPAFDYVNTGSVIAFGLQAAVFFRHRHAAHLPHMRPWSRLCWQASNGEISGENGAALLEYKREYVEPFAEVRLILCHECVLIIHGVVSVALAN
jgi:hypothetical protein